MSDGLTPPMAQRAGGCLECRVLMTSSGRQCVDTAEAQRAGGGVERRVAHHRASGCQMVYTAEG